MRTVNYRSTAVADGRPCGLHVMQTSTVVDEGTTCGQFEIHASIALSEGIPYGYRVMESSKEVDEASPRGQCGHILLFTWAYRRGGHIPTGNL